MVFCRRSHGILDQILEEASIDTQYTMELTSDVIKTISAHASKFN